MGWDSEYKRKMLFIIGISLLIVLFFFFSENFSLPVRAISAIIFLIVFYAVDHYFDLKFKFIHYIVIIFIALTTMLLSPLYFVFPFYDKIQHLVLAMLSASLVYHVVSQSNLNAKWRLAFTFFATLAVAILFQEIGEFILDLLFDFKLQGVFLRDPTGVEKFLILQDRNDDTMIDMILGVIGTLIYVLFASSRIKMKSSKATSRKRN